MAIQLILNKPWPALRILWASHTVVTLLHATKSSVFWSFFELIYASGVLDMREFWSHSHWSCAYVSSPKPFHITNCFSLWKLLFPILLGSGRFCSVLPPWSYIFCLGFRWRKIFRTQTTMRLHVAFLYRYSVMSFIWDLNYCKIQIQGESKKSHLNWYSWICNKFCFPFDINQAFTWSEAIYFHSYPCSKYFTK